MTVQTTIAVPAQQRRGWLVVSTVLLAAAIVAVVTVVFATGGRKASGSTGGAATSTRQARYGSAAMASIMALTPARFAAGALGTGYALPSRQSGLTVASVLASMSPQTRRYTKAVMSQTFSQLAAGAAGSP